MQAYRRTRDLRREYYARDQRPSCRTRVTTRPMWCRLESKSKFQCELDQSRIVVLGADNAKCRRTKRVARGTKLGMVEQVEELGSELQVYPVLWAEGSILDQSPVEIRQPIPAKIRLYAGHVAESEGCRLREAGRVEPFIEAAYR
jgi:hypothetical protein